MNQIEELKTKNTLLQEKNISLQKENEVMLFEEDTEEEEVIEIPDVIPGKYIFLCSPPFKGNAVQHQKILEKFPESRFAYSVDKITADCDAVVCITKDLKEHSDYYKGRKICANLGIKFLHTRKQNIDMIARDIILLRQIQSHVNYSDL